MLRCLTEKLDELKSEDCRKEVYYFQKMEVSNYHNDVILAAQCRNDVEKFCKNVQAGEGCAGQLGQVRIIDNCLWCPCSVSLCGVSLCGVSLAVCHLQSVTWYFVGVVYKAHSIDTCLLTSLDQQSKC